MIQEDVLCSSCDCICNDITVDVEDDQIKRVMHACCLGASKIVGQERIKVPQIRENGELKEVGYQEAYDRAAQILLRAKKPQLYGWASTAREVQKSGILLVEEVGGVLCIAGDGDDYLGREMRGEMIVVDGNAGNCADAGYGGEKCGMRGEEIEIGGHAGSFLAKNICAGSIKVGGDAGDFPEASDQRGTIIIGGSTYLPGAEMTKGSITIKVSAKMLPSCQKMDSAKIEGIDCQKYVGDLVENGKGKIYVAISAQQSS